MEKIKDLYKNGRELTLLEYAYGFVCFVSIVLAGLIALLNQSLGVAILIVPLVSFVAFVMNLVAWAIIRMAIEHVFPELRAAAPEKTETAGEAEKPVKIEKEEAAEKVAAGTETAKPKKTSAAAKKPKSAKKSASKK